MDHKIKICVSKEPPKDGVVSCKKTTVKKNLFRKLFGNSQKVTIIIPGDSVQDVTIQEVDAKSGGDKSGS